MAKESGLWGRSPAWRRTVATTLLLSGVVVALAPWRQPIKGSGQMATYTAPPISQAGFVARQTTVATPAAYLPKTGTTGHNPAFDVAAGSLNAPLPPGTELHLVGVYQGAPPAGEKQEPWWAKCKGLHEDRTAMAECHRKYAGQHTARDVAVSVTRSRAPMALVLMSYEPVVWQLSVASNARIVKIILAGYYGQDVRGAPTGVPIEARTYEASPCLNCSRQGDYFYAYKQDSSEFENASRKLQSITGLAPTSFQGTYKADRFFISNETANGHGYRESPDDKGDIYTDKTFRENVRVAGQEIALPPGIWQGLAYFDAPTNRGRNRLVAFGRLDNAVVREVIAVRVQTAGDGNGFPRFPGCDTTPRHAGQVTANESFGTQLCYEVSHVTDAWSQPLLQMAANKLRASGITVSNTVVAASFHRADAKRSVDFQLYAIPEARISDENAGWDASLWHPSRLKADSDQGPFVEEQVKWAKTWHQIFALSP